MFDKFMRFIGWKKISGKWDTTEIKIDIASISFLVLVAYAVLLIQH